MTKRVNILTEVCKLRDDIDTILEAHGIDNGDDFILIQPYKNNETIQVTRADGEYNLLVTNNCIILDKEDATLTVFKESEIERGNKHV